MTQTIFKQRKENILHGYKKIIEQKEQEKKTLEQKLKEAGEEQKSRGKIFTKTLNAIRHAAGLEKYTKSDFYDYEPKEMHRKLKQTVRQVQKACKPWYSRALGTVKGLFTKNKAKKETASSHTSQYAQATLPIQKAQTPVQEAPQKFYAPATHTKRNEATLIYANKLVKQNKYDESLKTLEEHCSTKSTKDFTARVEEIRAKAYFWKGDFEKAEEHYSKSNTLSKIKTVNDDRKFFYAASQIFNGKLGCNKKHNGFAKKFYETANVIKQKNKKGAVRCMIYAAKLAKNQNTALECAKQAIQLTKQDYNLENAVDALEIMGNIYGQRNENEKARKCMGQALALLKGKTGYDEQRKRIDSKKLLYDIRAEL